MDSKKTVIILGSSSGIGSKIIKYFSKNAQVYLTYGKNKPVNFKRFNTIKLDLNNFKSLEKNLKKIKINNKKLIILNLAATKIDKLAFNVTSKNLKETFNINTFAFLKVIQYFLPLMMKNKWGRIISFSSTGGSTGEKGTLLYTSSKNATHGMIKVMSKEFAKFNITFNTIKLGNFDTGLFKKLDNEIKRKILKKIPSNKTGNFKDIYNAIKFLTDSGYVNGSIINIDGGYTV